MEQASLHEGGGVSRLGFLSDQPDFLCSVTMFDDVGVTSKLIVTLLSRTLVAYSSEWVEDDVNAIFTRGGPPPGRGSWLDVIADALVPTQGDASSASATAGYKVAALEYGGTDVNVKVRGCRYGML